MKKKIKINRLLLGCLIGALPLAHAFANSDYDDESRLIDQAKYIYESSVSSGLYDTDKLGETFKNKLGVTPHRLKNSELSRLNKTNDTLSSEALKSAKPKKSFLGQLIFNPFTVFFIVLVGLFSYVIRKIFRVNKRLTTEKFGGTGEASLPSDMVIYKQDEEGGKSFNRLEY